MSEPGRCWCRGRTRRPEWSAKLRNAAAATRRLHQRRVRSAASRPRALPAGGAQLGRRAHRRASIPIDRRVRSRRGTAGRSTPTTERAEVLAALACVDAVVIFDEDTPHEIVSALQPDSSSRAPTGRPAPSSARDIVEARGGRVVRIPLAEGYSTTKPDREVFDDNTGRIRRSFAMSPGPDCRVPGYVSVRMSTATSLSVRSLLNSALAKSGLSGRDAVGSQG